MLYHLVRSRISFEAEKNLRVPALTTLNHTKCDLGLTCTRCSHDIQDIILGSQARLVEIMYPLEMLCSKIFCKYLMCECTVILSFQQNCLDNETGRVIAFI